MLKNNTNFDLFFYYLNSGFDFEKIPTNFDLLFLNDLSYFFLVILNLGFIGFLIALVAAKSFFNSIICKVILALIFILQYSYFIYFVAFLTSLNFYPFGINLILNVEVPFFNDFQFGIFLNPLNYNFVIITIFLTFFCFLLTLTEKKIDYLNFNNNNQKAIQNIFLINLFSLNVFLTNNLIFFFFFLECAIFPMVFLIGFFGPRLEKTKAATLYFYVSLLSGFFIFFGLGLLSY